jgi:hypothetical protein
MLRGHATLQKIIGKGVRKGGAGKAAGPSKLGAKRYASDPLPSQGDARPSDLNVLQDDLVEEKVVAEQEAALSAGKLSGDLAQEALNSPESLQDGLPEGYARCPVCHKLLENDPKWMNMHLGKLALVASGSNLGF